MKYKTNAALIELPDEELFSFSIENSRTIFSSFGF
jgi:hypothetical protein